MRCGGRGLILISGLARSVASAPLSVSNAPTSEITICGDVVPAALVQANATFQVFYQLETDGSGKVKRVAKLRNDILPERSLVACLQR
jgi:hypothetical protein